MSLKDIASLGKLLAQFLTLFAGCFSRQAGRDLLAVYVRGLLSDVQRKNAEAIALDQGISPRTLQRFLESIVWDQDLLRDQCQRLIAAEHAHPDAIGCIDETGTAKSGHHTAGVKRQYNGNRGKVENCINSVALSYTSEDFHCLLDAQLYLPQEWCDDPVRRKKTTYLTILNLRQSPKLHWNSLIAPKPTEYALKLGPSMNCMAAMVSSLTVSISAMRASWAKFHLTSILGSLSPNYWRIRRRNVLGVPNDRYA